MRTLAVLAAIVGIALAGASVARAADPVNAAATVDRTSITVGDRIALAIIVDTEPGYLPSDPTIARQIGAFEVVQTQAVQKSTRLPDHAIQDIVVHRHEAGFTVPKDHALSARDGLKRLKVGGRQMDAEFEDKETTVRTA